LWEKFDKLTIFHNKQGLDMVETTLQVLREASIKKSEFGGKFPFRYFILSMMAGIYVGFGIVLIFSIGAPVALAGNPFLKALMGASFGIALTLVIFAGSELFTGNNMVLMVGSLDKAIKWRTTINLWLLCYAGNLAGALLFSYAYAHSGLANSGAMAAFIAGVAKSKMSAPFPELFIRGILCNMLVCLAVWTSLRAKEDTAKLILIFWCLFGFIGSGYEHSIANMTVLGVPLFLPGSFDGVSWYGFAWNMAAVSLGNLVGGAFFIGAAYWLVGRNLPQKS
jgi:nitrite transporter NirC